MNRQYDESFAASVMSPAGQAGWAGNNFGTVISHVQTITAHFTAGWPRRDGGSAFVSRFTTNAEPGFHGIGPQLYISGDGTVARLIQLDPPLHTGHAEWMNGVSVGVETGNLGTVSVPPAVGKHGPEWLKASADGVEDLFGVQLWITAGTPAQSEVVPAWWTTETYIGPSREMIFEGHMLFSEQEQQAWAVLARYLFENHRVPRNFPLLPHYGRRASISGADPASAFRRTVLADERSDMLQRAVAVPGFPPGSFDPANAAGFQHLYDAAVRNAAGGTQRHNAAYRAWCTTFRGLTGHQYIGSMLIVGGKANGEHDCPGTLFDFHRLARETSDYWWYPFDVVGAATAVPRRPYRTWNKGTPIIEYYWDENEADHSGRITTGVHGAIGSPDTFRLDAASPIYAMSNGELVAVRLPPPGAGVSTGFVLVRHDVFHLPTFPGVVFLGAQLAAGSIDYDIAPASVYTLYMHLERPANMNFDDYSEDNPDWLNRLIYRKKECDLGVAFFDAPPANPHDPAHHDIPMAMWNNRPPGLPQRATTLKGWQTDQRILTLFFAALSAGRIAHAPRQGMAVPARILLGDFLAESGAIRTDNAPVHGVRVETFAPSLAAPTFSVRATPDWSPPVVMQAPFCLQYQSEWARDPTAAERLLMLARGADPDALAWWNQVHIAQTIDGSLPPGSRLPDDGVIFHYQPLDFAKWLNGVTWASEWPKFEVTDAANAPVPRPARPRSRRT